MGPTDLLEQLRAALRSCSPVLYARLHAPDGEDPYLQVKRGRIDRRIAVASELGGYQWADTRQYIGGADDVDHVTRHIARAMDAPLRRM